MNTRILISLSVIGAVVAIAIGGTVAYFNATATSKKNTFTSGRLILSVKGAEGGTAGWKSPSNWAPGETADGYVVLKRGGTIGAKLMKLKIKDVAVQGGSPNIAQDVIVSKMIFTDKNGVGWDKLDAVKAVVGDPVRLSQLPNLTNFLLETGTFGPGETIGTLYMEFTYDPNATTQGARAKMEITFALEQIE